MLSNGLSGINPGWSFSDTTILVEVVILEKECVDRTLQELVYFLWGHSARTGVSNIMDLLTVVLDILFQTSL